MYIETTRTDIQSTMFVSRQSAMSAVIIWANQH